MGGSELILFLRLKEFQSGQVNNCHNWVNNLTNIVMSKIVNQFIDQNCIIKTTLSMF